MGWHHYLVVLGAVAMTTAEAEPQVPPSEVEVIELQRERFERLTVPVTIMGEGPFRFLIDTGAQATVVSRALADRLALTERAGATLVGMASSRRVETAVVPDLGLGSRLFTIRTAPLVEGTHIGDADGILGIDSLQDQRVLIDFANRRIAVADADTLGGNKGFDIVVRARERLGQLIIHRARVDGITTAIIVDTGAQGSIGNPALQARLRRANRRDDATITDVNGVQLTGEVRVVRRLEVDRMELSNVHLAFADSPTFRALGLDGRPAMVLGMAELRAFRRVAIDFSTSEILFDMPNDVHSQQAFLAGRQASRLRQ